MQEITKKATRKNRTCKVMKDYVKEEGACEGRQSYVKEEKKGLRVGRKDYVKE